MTRVAAKTDSAGHKPSRPRVTPEVTRAIASDILSGRYAAGSTLPSEMDLGAEHGVSRTVIRESLKMLAAKGLVHSRPRIGTIVCEKDDWNIIDPQIWEWYTPDSLDPGFSDAILEVRRALEPLVAELAAERASLHEIAELETAWRRMKEASRDAAGFARSDACFHQILYASCHNPIFRQIGGLIESILHATLAMTANLADRNDEALEAHWRVVEALRMRDGTAARKAAMEILDIATRDLARAKSQATSQKDDAQRTAPSLRRGSKP